MLVATTINCSAWRTGGGPLPPYWEYRLRGGAWITVPLSATSIGRKANLFVVYDEPLPADYLKVAQKEQIEREVNLAPVFLQRRGGARTLSLLSPARTTLLWVDPGTSKGA